MGRHFLDFATGDEHRGPGVPCASANNPAAGQWDGRKLSDRMLADYKPFVATDGQGIRCSLYVSGCPFHCAECWNESIWNFRAGHEYTDELEQQIMTDLTEPYVRGISFLGGEPLLNTPVLLPLARRIRAEFGDTRDIWCWTGYTWEELQRPGETPDKAELVELVDVLIDGRFIAAQKDSLLQFRGSANQRIIDVPASRRAGRPVIWGGLHDLARRIPELYGKQRAAAEGNG